jgi:transcriptional regulator with XRE-family HTH domain
MNTLPYDPTKLKAIAKANGLKLSHLAARAGISAPYASLVLSGRLKNPEYLERLRATLAELLPAKAHATAR